MKKPLLITLLIFTIFYILGHFGPSYLDGSTCLRFLGCNQGPLGYDALLHVISGALFVFFTLWLNETYLSNALQTKRFWINVFILIAIISLYSVVWEIIEYTHDSIRLAYNPSFPTLELDQPTNADTMGDLIISLLAAGATIPFVKKHLHNNDS